MQNVINPGSVVSNNIWLGNEMGLFEQQKHTCFTQQTTTQNGTNNQHTHSADRKSK